MNSLTCPLSVNSPVLHTRKLRHRGPLPIIVDNLAESRNTPSHFKYSGTFFCFLKGRILTPKRACANSANTEEEGKGIFEGGVKTLFKLHSEKLRNKTQSHQRQRRRKSKAARHFKTAPSGLLSESGPDSGGGGRGSVWGQGTSPGC